jgi:hypothetical protein
MSPPNGLAGATNAPTAPNLNWSGYAGAPGVSGNPFMPGGASYTGGAAFNNQSGGTGGNSIASNALQQVTNPEEQQAQYAQNMAQHYQQVGASAFANKAPTIATANGAQLAASQGNYGANAAAYGGLANAYGRIPQTAQAQFQQASGQALDANLAMAHSAQGGALGGAAAARAAQQQNAQQQGGFAGQSGIMAGQEQMAALGGQATAYAGQANAYGQAGAQNLSQYQIQQQVAQNQASLQQAQLGQNEQFYQNMATTAGNQQQIANQSTQSLGALGVQAGLGEAGTAVGAENATTSMVGTGSTIAAGVGGVVSGALPYQFPSDEQAKTGIEAEGNSNLEDTPVAHAATGGESTLLSSGATTSQEAGDIGVGALKGAGKGAGLGGFFGSLVPGLGTAIGAGIGAAIGAGVGGYTGGQGNVNTSGTTAGGAPVATSAGPSLGGIVGGGLGSIGAAGSIASDEDEKVGADGHVSLVDQFLKSIHPYSYEYKDPEDEPRAGGPTGGRYLGVMAQDLERAPAVGHQLVTDTPGGKRISVGAGLSAALAGLARVNERLSAVEGK